MAKVVRLQTEAGEFLIEADETVTVPVGKRPGRPGVPEGMEEVVEVGEIVARLDEVRALIVACGNQLVAAVKEIPTPETFCVEFGVKLAAEGGVPLLTKASGEASFKVALTWKNP